MSVTFLILEQTIRRQSEIWCVRVQRPTHLQNENPSLKGGKIVKKVKQTDLETRRKTRPLEKRCAGNTRLGRWDFDISLASEYVCEIYMRYIFIIHYFFLQVENSQDNPR